MFGCLDAIAYLASLGRGKKLFFRRQHLNHAIQFVHETNCDHAFTLSNSYLQPLQHLSTAQQ